MPHRPTTCRRNGSIAIAVTGAISVFLGFAVMTNVFAVPSLVRDRKRVLLNSDLRDLRLYILSNHVCPSACTPGTFIPLTDKTGATLVADATSAGGVPPNYTKLSQADYLMRARCVDCSAEAPCVALSKSKRVSVEFLRGTQAPSASPHPLKDGPTSGWDDWQDLFRGVKDSLYWCLVT